MSRKQIIVLALTGGFIALIIIFGVLRGDGMLPGMTAPPDGTGGDATGGLDGVAGSERKFTPEIPEDVVPTVPAQEAPAAPGSSASLGIFEMSVSSSGFNPSPLAVRLGNLVQIRLTAVGGDFDFSMPWTGLYQKVNEGETRQISFQTTAAGTYVFECRDFCPMGRIIRGELIVTP